MNVAPCASGLRVIGQIYLLANPLGVDKLLVSLFSDDSDVLSLSKLSTDDELKLRCDWPLPCSEDSFIIVCSAKSFSLAKRSCCSDIFPWPLLLVSFKNYDEEDMCSL